MKNWLQPITLKGKLVTLLPMTRLYRAGMLAAIADGNLSALWYTAIPSEENIDAYFESAENEQKSGLCLPFVVIDNTSGNLIGASRFCNIEAAHKRLEIGYTWYAKSFQRTGVNTECKSLLLGHAFDTKDAIAVEFRTSWHNQDSRAAILRIGAKQDGILRNHRLSADGLIRDTVVFSIIAGEWPSVKRALEHKMQR
jgi:RimJ/RimL family protein N-acetyltransferase